MHTVILMLGSNLGNRKENLESAVSELEQRTGTIQHMSEVYETEPWGMESERTFYNQCISLSTILDPSGVLEQIRTIEQQLGRPPSRVKFTDRTIDIDILFFDDLVMSREDLVIPHPGIRDRRFVIIPVLEIYPEYIHPGSGESMKDILRSCKDMKEVRIAPAGA